MIRACHSKSSRRLVARDGIVVPGPVPPAGRAMAGTIRLRADALPGSHLLQWGTWQVVFGRWEGRTSVNVQADRVAWFQGGSAACGTPPADKASAMRLVLLGPPGVGKGTQAELLSRALGACHLSTGDIFRAAKSLNPCECSPAVAEALDVMRKGGLVSDDTVIAMVRERTRCVRCQGGFLLDGFPRTVAQAEALDQLLAESSVALSGVISYEMDIEEIVNRLGGRRTCTSCKAVYHVTGRPPRVEGVCDSCGGELIQREDDRPESIRVRMAAYDESTLPLAGYYAAKGLLIRIPATGTPDEILDRTLAALNV